MPEPREMTEEELEFALSFMQRDDYAYAVRAHVIALTARADRARDEGLEDARVAVLDAITPEMSEPEMKAFMGAAEAVTSLNVRHRWCRASSACP